MDNQKPTEGAGSSMGKDTSSGNASGNVNNAARDLSTDAGKTIGDLTDGARDLSANAGKAIDNAKESAKDAVNNLTRGLPKNADDVHATIDRAASAAQPLVDKLATSAHAGVDRISGALTGAGDSFNDKTAHLRDAYGNLVTTSRDYVRTSPGTAIALAVGAGYILSKLLGTRK